MELPHNTSISREMRERRGGRTGGRLADQDWVQHGFEDVREAGYTVIDGCTAVGPLNPLVYRELLRGADMIGVELGDWTLGRCSLPERVPALTAISRKSERPLTGLADSPETGKSF